MRARVSIPDDLLAEAEAYAGISDRSELVNECLRALIQREASRRRATLGVSQPRDANVSSAQDTKET